MPDFAYKAIKSSGQVIGGVRFAESESALLADLRQHGCLPVQVEMKGGRKGIGLRFWGRGGLSSKDRLMFVQQLATLVRAGIPLDRCLALSKDLAETEALREVIDGTLKELQAGRSLANSLAARSDFFPTLYVAMVRAGEASGMLPQVLDRLVEFEQFREELRSYLVSAMIYPAVLATVGGIAIGVLLGFVVPRFAQIFVESGKELPLPTQVLMQVATAFRQYGWLAALVLVLFASVVHYWIKTPAGRLAWDRLKLKIPLLAPIVLKMEIARFAKTLGTLLSQTVPFVPALRLTHDVLGNRVLADLIEPLIQGVKRGQGLAGPLQAAGLFPPLAVQLATLGEQTGKLDAMLLQVSDIYDREVRTATKRLVALVEPAVILVMGLIVGFIVVSTMLAIVSINEVPF